MPLLFHSLDVKRFLLVFSHWRHPLTTSQRIHGISGPMDWWTRWMSLERGQRGHGREAPFPRPEHDEAGREHHHGGQLLPLRPDGQRGQRSRKREVNSLLLLSLLRWWRCVLLLVLLVPLLLLLLLLLMMLLLPEMPYCRRCCCFYRVLMVAPGKKETPLTQSGYTRYAHPRSFPCCSPAQTVFHKSPEVSPFRRR